MAFKSLTAKITILLILATFSVASFAMMQNLEVNAKHTDYDISTCTFEFKTHNKNEFPDSEPSTSSFVYPTVLDQGDFADIEELLYIEVSCGDQLIEYYYPGRDADLSIFELSNRGGGIDESESAKILIDVGDDGRISNEAWSMHESTPEDVEYNINISSKQVATNYYNDVLGTDFDQREEVRDEDSREDLPSGNTTEEDSGEPGCQADVAFGWVLCGTIELISNIVGWVVDTIILPFLEVSPLERTNPVTGNETIEYTVWNNIRTLANVLLVPIFLFIILSQISSLNIDAYTLKKIAPRLALAFIGIQVSFFIVAFMVDITAILGNGIGDLMNFPIRNTDLQLAPESAGLINNVESTSLFFGAIVGGGVTLALAAAGSIAIGGLWVMLLSLLPTVLAVFFTLIFRQILVILLAVLSPVAIAAMVLPNTNKIYQLWMDTFQRVLIMYPLIVLLFAAADLVTVIALSTTDSVALGFILALGVSVVPLAMIPLTFRFAGKTLAIASNAAQNFTQKRVSGADGKGGPLARARERVAQNKLEARAGTLGSDTTLGNARSWVGKHTTARGLGSRLPGRAGSKSEGLAAASLMQAAGAAEKDLESASPATLKEFARHGASGKDLQNRIRELQQDGETEKADSLKQMMQYTGSSSHQIAALGKAAEYGQLSDEEGLNAAKAVSGALSGSSGARAAAIGQIGYKSRKANSILGTAIETDENGVVNRSPKSITKALGSATTEMLAKTQDLKLDKNNEFKNDEVTDAIKYMRANNSDIEVVQQVSNLYDSIDAALDPSSSNPVSGAQRASLEKLRNELP